MFIGSDLQFVNVQFVLEESGLAKTDIHSLTFQGMVFFLCNFKLGYFFITKFPGALTDFSRECEKVFLPHEGSEKFQRLSRRNKMVLLVISILSVIGSTLYARNMASFLKLPWWTCLPLVLNILAFNFSPSFVVAHILSYESLAYLDVTASIIAERLNYTTVSSKVSLTHDIRLLSLGTCMGFKLKILQKITNIVSAKNSQIKWLLCHLWCGVVWCGVVVWCGCIVVVWCGVVV